LKLRALIGTLLFAGLHAASTEAPKPQRLLVDFPFTAMPRHLWARELIWLKNIGVRAIAVSHASAELETLAGEAGIAIQQPEPKAVRISALDANAIIQSRMAAHSRQQIVWTNVETEVTPEFKSGAVSLEGAEDMSLQALRREALLWEYWPSVLLSEGAEERKPAGLELDEQRSTLGASAINLVNTSGKVWHGPVTAAVGSVARTVVIPDVTVPAHDALLLPVDVAFGDPAFCRFCTGMSNSERLLYATAELSAIEYENGILSFEFVAPVAGVAVLQLEREPEGPMLAAGHPTEFDWDPDSKRARLPIPAGKAPNHRVRIAVAMTGPDHVASFVDTHVMVIGQTNHVVTDYSPPAIAARSRLVLPEGWKSESSAKPGKVSYAVEVPSTRLHGDHAELRIETDGLTISHTRVQLLRPLSIHVAEAEAIHFGGKAELKSDPPLVTVETPTGRNINLQLRNNAPEIRTFQVEMEADGLEFSPAKTEISIGASTEREVSIRIFSAHSAAGIHHGSIRVTGPASEEKPIRFAVMPRGGAVTYSTDLLDAGGEQKVWENARLRAVFSKADGGRWLEFYWKPSGKSLLPADGIAIAKPVKVELRGDELVMVGSGALPALPAADNVSVILKREGLVSSYRVIERDAASTATNP
jgi:hypothetical protein